MRKSLEELLIDRGSISWDDWREVEDLNSIREAFGPKGAEEFWHLENWYTAAMKHDAARYRSKKLRPNFGDWKRPFWTVHEATLLALGLDPNRFNQKEIEADADRSVFSWYYSRLRNIILQNQKDGTLPTQLRPRVFIEWASESRILCTPEIELAISEHDDPSDDLAWLYKAQVRENDLLRAELRTLQDSTMKQPDDTVVEMVVELRTPGAQARVIEAIEAIWKGDVAGVKEKKRHATINKYLRDKGYSEVSLKTVSRALREMRQRKKPRRPYLTPSDRG